MADAEKPELENASSRKLADPVEVLAELKTSIGTVQLATLGDDGLPHSGYAPFIFDGVDIIIFVSQLALHTRDLLANGKVSVMLIDDESKAREIFARTRVSYQCEAAVVASDANTYEPLLDALQARHGKMIGLLRQLPDFVLFRLSPNAGQFVMGFGQAYKLTGAKFDIFEHARRA